MRLKTERICIIYRSVLIVLWCITCINDLPALNKNTNLPDSIRQQIETLSDSSRLEYLHELVKTNFQKHFFTEYLDIYEKEAARLNNKEHLIHSLVSKAKYYYMERDEELDSLLKQIEPVFMDNGGEKEWIDINRLNLYILTRQGKNHEVMEGVDKLKNLAKQINYAEGEEIINESLAYFYFLNNMPDDAEKIYHDILKSRKDRKATAYEQISTLIQLVQFAKDTDNRLAYAKQAESLLNEIKKDNENIEKYHYNLVRYEYIVEWTYASDMIRRKKFADALIHLEKVKRLVEDNDMETDRAVGIDQLYYDYYMALAEEAENEYSRKKYIRDAIPYLDKVIEVARDQNVQSSLSHYLSQKADVYSDLEEYKKVVDIQKELMALNDSIHRTGYQERLANIRTQYEVDKLELEKQQIELKSKQTGNLMILWIVGCLLLIIIIAALIYVIHITRKGKATVTKAKEKAEEADRMKSIFLANMNHEIRTPLNAIVGFSQLLVDEEDKETRQTFASIIQTNNELLQQLIADVLDISKIESNTMSLFCHKQNLPEIMKEVYNMITLRIPDHVELILDPCEPLFFKTDRNRLIQVITNLLTNSIKHTSDGRIRFGYTIGETDVQFYVEDTGEGIPEEQLESIFNRFTQLENGRKGAGLGLAISKGLITQMGGRIWVESEMGKGSTFYIQLPIEKDV